MVSSYYRLAKPERTLTNVLTAAAGYLFGSEWHVEWSTFTALIIGSTLVIASACTLNNIFDKDLDKKMERTNNRAMATGEISSTHALVYAGLLGLAGFGLLALTNGLTVMIIGLGYLGYVGAYGYSKRHTVHSTLIGTLPGAASLVAGYTAAANQFDKAALILFLIMLSWQMAHFYAIAIFRLKDYTAAKIPVMPAKVGVRSTKLQIMVYIVLFVITSGWLAISGYAGYTYFLTVTLLGLLWAGKSLSAFNRLDSVSWARQVFKFSLVVILVLCVLLSVGSVLP